MAMKAMDQKARGRGGGGAEEKKQKPRVEGRRGEEPDFFFCVWLLPPSPPLVFFFFFFCLFFLRLAPPPLPSTLVFFFLLRHPPPPPAPDFLAEVCFGAQDTTNRSRNSSILWDPISYTQRYDLKARFISSTSYVKWVCLCQCLLKRLINYHMNSKLHKERS